MSVKLKELQEKRNRIITEMKSLIDKAERSRSGFSAQEQEKYDRLLQESTNLRFHIDAELSLIGLEAELSKNQSGKAYNDPGASYRSAMRKLLVLGHTYLSAEEKRALTAGTDNLGGFLTMPNEWSASLIAAVTNLVHIRALATKYTLEHSTNFYGPSIENDFDDPDWTGENTTVNLDADFNAGRRELTPHLLHKGVVVSNRLLHASAGLAENIVIDRLAYKIGIAEEKTFLTGTGAQQPLGVLTPSNQGIPTSRDIVVALNVDGWVTDNSSSYKNLYDALMAAKYSLKSQYWPKSEWFLHKDILKVVALLKDGDGNLIYHCSDNPIVPDTLLGRPINLSEYVPNTISSGNYIAILGDFSWYSICDLQEMEIRILKELYALTNQTGFIIREYTDGMPVVAEAFARIQIQ